MSDEPGTYLDDVLWPAVLEPLPYLTGDAMRRAWEAYCERAESPELAALTAFIVAAGVADIDGFDIFPIVRDHGALGELVEVVKAALAE